MGFDNLLGNQRLKDNLTAAISRGRISHFYLISGPVGSGKKTLARLLSAAILCRGEAVPCLSCSACRKVMGDNHPDMITVLDPEHKNVAVKIVRQIREDMFIRPNEADKKIYIFPQELGIEGQNALLKILEEPPSYGVFMLLTDNPEKLLPTVRSRATELRLERVPAELLQKKLRQDFPDADEQTLSAAIQRGGGYPGQVIRLLQDGSDVSGQTRSFVESFIQKDVPGLVSTLVPMQKWKRDQLLPELQQWAQVLQQALVCRSGAAVLSPMARELGSQRSSSEILAALHHLQKAIEYTQGNVSPAAVCGWLEWALR
jgi:DNA polymerase-3 subunit delta'